MPAGKHIYTEKPTAETLDEAIELAAARPDAGITAGVVHDKLYLPGLVKLRRLVDEGFFGRILSLRGEFGYWVFEGDIQPAQRPSWNYRSEDGGGMTVDMFCHWNYVLEGILGRVQSVTAKTATHIPTRWDEQGQPYAATADDASYGIFELEGGIIAQINSSWAVRVYRDELVEFQIDGTHGSAVAGLNKCVAQQRAPHPEAGLEPGPAGHRSRSATSGWRSPPTPIWTTASSCSGRSSSATSPPAGRTASTCCPPPAACSSPNSGLQSSAEGRRLEIPEIAL